MHVLLLLTGYMPANIMANLSSESTIPILQDSLLTTQTIMHNGVLESRVIYVTNTNGTLTINVPRRTYKPINNELFNFSNIPHHVFGYEVLNNYKVYPNSKLNINNGKHILDIKSMVNS